MPTLFQISISINSGSIGRIAEQIGQMAITQGWSSHITYARNFVLPSTSKAVKIGNIFDMYWHGITTRLFDNHCLSSTYATKKLIKKIRQIKPDIIQIHNIHGYYINMKILFNFLKNTDMPVVWTLHDCWSFTGHCVHFDYLGCEKWLTGCGNCPQKGEYPASKFLDRSYRNYVLKKRLFDQMKNMTIIPVSFWLEKLVKKSLLKNHPIRVIPNGIDTSIFYPIMDTRTVKKKYGINGKFILLGAANIWGKRKGFDDFVALNKIINHDMYIIVLVGLNNEQKKKIPKEMIGIERTENVDELAALYSVADVYISCSVEETFGLTIAESMACSTPVIAYNCTAIPELVDNNTGFIVERGDVESLYKAIVKIQKKGKQYYAISCREKIMKYYNKKKCCNKYMTLYDSLLQ